MKLKQNVWKVAIRKRDQNDGWFKSNNSYLAIPNPPFKWAADPFILEKSDKVYIFAELFDLFKWRGDVAYCIYENGKFSRWEIIITDKHHFSFPNIIEYLDNIYLMPETGRISELALYKAVDFPKKWEKIHVFSQEGNFADSVFINETTMLSYYNDGNGLNLALLIKENDKFVLKAIKRDTKLQMRPAGKVFTCNGKTIRPVQDCINFYGEAINFNQLSSITEITLPEEETIYRLEANKISVSNDKKHKIIGTHTYNFSDNYEVIDFQYERFNPFELAKRLQIKAKKIICRK